MLGDYWLGNHLLSGLNCLIKPNKKSSIINVHKMNTTKHGYNNYGYYIPTIPFPLIGHDDFKAWGMTMFENDEVDLYKETFNPRNKVY